MKTKLFLLMALVLCLMTGFALAEATYTEEVISIPNGDHEIPATVVLPANAENVPAVVMLHGTGSNREEAGNGYQMAAPVLAEKYGIATIRIDFMGNGDSKADYTGYTFDSAVSDAVAAAKYMAALPQVKDDAIGVMGWSQGGTDALLAAGRHPEAFKAVVTWAGAPDLSNMLTPELEADAEKNGYFVMTFDWRDALHVSKQWVDDVKNTDVLAVFSAFEGPVLAIHGEQDTTVDPAWSDKIVAASKNPASAKHMIAGMDHTFNVFSEGDAGYPALYNAVDATGAFFAEQLK